MRSSAATTASQAIYTTLIRTHHITSRKKLQRVKKAAVQLSVPYVLIRSGGAPGIMYAEAKDKTSVTEWVAFVQGLRYKDYQCVQKPTAVAVSSQRDSETSIEKAGFEEVETTAEFAARLRQKGLETWFNQGMGYDSDG